MADVVKVEHENGDVSIGVEIEGTYVPFATVTAARIAGLQERADTLSERLKGDDQAAKDAVAQLPISAKSPSKPQGEKGGGS